MLSSSDSAHGSSCRCSQQPSTPRRLRRRRRCIFLCQIHFIIVSIGPRPLTHPSLTHTLLAAVAPQVLGRRLQRMYNTYNITMDIMALYNRCI